jgi:hypothetical protein
VAETSLPWGNSGQPTPPEMYQDRWRRLFNALVGDGVCNDLDETGLRVTATGSSTQIQIAAGEAVVQGAHYLNDATLTKDLAAFGTPPTSTQWRYDVVVLRYDPVAQTVLATVVPGAPSASSPTDPALQANPTGTWDFRLARIERLGNVAVTQDMITDRRRWCSPIISAHGDTPLPGTAPIGAIGFQQRDIQRRGTNGGVPAWLPVLDPDWTALSLPSGVSQSLPSARWRIFSGLVQLVGAVEKSSGTWAANSTVHVATLPTTARPTADVYAPVSCPGGGASAGRATIRSATGQIGVLIPTSGVSAVSLGGLQWDAA